MYRATLIALALAGAAQAEDSDAPVKYHSHGMTVIMHSSAKPIDLVVGDNVIGKPHSFTCQSEKGCVVIMAVSAQETNIPFIYN